MPPEYVRRVVLLMHVATGTDDVQSAALQHAVLAMQAVPQALKLLLQPQVCADVEQVALAWHSVLWQQAVLAMQVPLQLLGVVPPHTQAPPVQVAPVWHSVLWQHALLAMQAPLQLL